MDALKQSIMSILLQYLTENESTEMISVFADRAMLAFQEYRNYPSKWDDEAILADMNKHKSCIADLALYECIQQGAEFQSMHIESGLYRMWNNKGNIYTQHRVVPFVTM
jgi:hypothetical protein